jgi:hypothetical protein
MSYRTIRPQRWFADGFVLTVDDDGFQIEVTDYHAKPLHLGWGKLRELGLVPGGVERNAGDACEPQARREGAI